MIEQINRLIEDPYSSRTAVEKWTRVLLAIYETKEAA